MLLYVAALAGAGMAVQPLVAIYVTAALAAWLVLLHALIVPVSALRRALALGGDVAFLGLFLHWGGAAAAPWAALYLVLGFDYGLRFGAAALVARRSAAPSDRRRCGHHAGLARDAARRPRDFTALALLPLYGAALAGRAKAGEREAAARRGARHRLAAALGHELRAPLDALAPGRVPAATGGRDHRAGRAGGARDRRRPR